jgi:GNAT superfamily N-acetyltransferase
MIKYRNAKKEDIEGIISLQEKYLFANLSDKEKGDGFVTTPFTEEQVLALIDSKGAFLALDSDKVIGYAFAADWKFWEQWPIFPYMVSRMPLLNFETESVNAQNTYQYGPVCLDLSYRGQGIFENLFETHRIEMSKRYPIGLTFINKINERSYQAHTKKLGLTVIDEFHFNDRNYYGLGFRTSTPVVAEIKPYSAQYFSEVTTLIPFIQSTEFGVPISLNDQPDLLDIETFYQSRGNFWVATVGDKVVGTIAIFKFENDKAALRKMFVYEEFRGKRYNIAQKLLDALQNWSIENGISKIYLGTLPRFVAARKFYERNGFTEFDMSNLPDTLVRMKLDSIYYYKEIN